MPSSRFKGGWALILGASSGIGAATALTLARQGMNIFGIHLDRRSTVHLAEKVRAGIEEAGRQAAFFNVNAASPEKRAQVIKHLAERMDSQPAAPLRTVVHSLAFGSLEPFISHGKNGRIQPRQLEMTLDVMAHSLVYWVQDLCERGLVGEGSRIFAMTSEGSSLVWPGYGAVSAAKAALESHVRQLAFELAPMGATVNAVMPGVTDTPALRKIPGHESMMEAAAKRNPHRRITTPEDVAELIAALSQEGCGWITGETIRVDGGEHLTA